MNKSYRVQNRSSCSKPENANTAPGRAISTSKLYISHAKDDFGCIYIKILNLSFNIIETEFSIVFTDYFKLELQQLETMQTDGLLTVSHQNIQVLPAGRLLIRNICMVFDRYLAQKNQQFSKVI